jgi:uncharacterized damage-inducible protein DinB
MKSTLQRLLIVSVLLSGFIFSKTGFGQATINADDLKTQLLKDWQRAKDYTVSYLDAMPADKYSFKANDSVRSFAQQMLHLAQANINLSASGTGLPRLYMGVNLEKSPGAQTRDSVMFYVKASYDYVIDGITKLDAAKLGEKVGSGNSSMMRLTWIDKAFEHQTHHRGQTTIYIRLVGIRPPNERLF